MPGKKFHMESTEGVEAILERMWEAVGRPLVGYARAFDVSESNIKNWRHRGRVSRVYLEGFANEHGVSLDWLLHGDQAPAEPPMVSEKPASYGIAADERKLLDNYRKCQPEVREALQVVASIASRPGVVSAAPVKTRVQRHGGEVERVLRSSVAPSGKKPGRQRGPGDDAK